MLKIHALLPPPPALLLIFMRPAAQAFESILIFMAVTKFRPIMIHLSRKSLPMEKHEKLPWHACAMHWMKLLLKELRTNIPLHQDILRGNSFQKGLINIHYLEKWMNM